MNRDQFTEYTAKLLQTRNPAPLRLEDMNPFAAMDYLKRHFNDAAACPVETVLDIWAESMTAEKYRAQALASKGVRASLATLFNLYAGQGRELWLPEDTYPFYWNAARESGLAPRSFPTLPAPDFSFLTRTGPDAVLLLSNPLTPLGRALDDEETSKLSGWLAGSPNRRLMMDAVYVYDRKFDDNTRRLFETGQSIIAHSLSKSWLERGVFGILLVPDADRAQIEQGLEPPPARACASAAAALQNQPDLPLVQAKAFADKWRELAPTIRRFAPDFTPPQSGYFAAVNARYDEVLARHNITIIPATVFGSPRKDISIVSCLQQMGPKPA